MYPHDGTTLALAKAGFSVTTGSANTVAIANSTDYAIGGKAYTKASGTGITTPTTDKVTGNAIVLDASQGVAIVVALDSSGNVVFIGSTVETLDSSNDFEIYPPFGPVDFDTYCPIAYMTLLNGSTGSKFTVGTTDWNATGMTVNVQDVATLPNRPQKS